MIDANFHDLQGKTVYITGGASGIGAALTKGFLEQGAKVGCVGRSPADEFVDQMEQETGNRPLFIQCDITDIPALKQSMQDVQDQLGPIDVLVNNAANDQRHSTLEVTEEFWDWSQSINLKAYFFACQSVVPMMQSRGGGSIINFTSISYMMGNTGYPAYTSANSGINGMTRSLAREFGPDAIRVNALAPGWVLTDKQLEMWATPEALADHLERQCLKEHLKPEDIVAATLFLASSASRMITGQSLVVDGGVVVTG
ncbi:3-oxoacyl-ACP reductase [Marivivens niveibacter]|uniref:3-oxoacyl-ACP reductase n=1 Tax=Marivivens niveibacter TaxID=1930667 RepID=A0A251WWL8_9RHOB|nr:SDR family oxidoreductase [Marivivens niveibacter]OUD08528.1 3-oxoacyl-ACP reductase [Marivivens niveibacter]